MISAAVNSHDALTGAACFLVMLVLAGGLLFLNDRLFRRSKPKKEAAARVYENRLLNPDIAGLEKHFGHALPAGLKDLFKNQAEVLRENFTVSRIGMDGKGQSWDIAFYEPLDLEHVNEAWPDMKEVIEFANDGCGNGFTVDPRLDDPPVMFYDHETAEWEQVAKNLAEFLAMKRG